MLGFGLTALGIGAYAAQFAVGRLTMPWYLPVSGTLAAVSVAIALFQSRGVWRGIALVLLALVASAEWMFLLGTGLPAYTGTQVAEGKPFPEFVTARVDGTPFTRRDLEGDRDTVMVFFRGRW